MTDRNQAIAIRVKPAEDGYDLGASKFFGTPTIPHQWQEDFDEDEIFFCQIRLADIAALDTENKLPHTGYLYVFLHTEDGKYHLRADLRYYDGEPDMALEGFNAVVEEYASYTDAWLMEFSHVAEDEVCTRLFGVPGDWNYAEQPPQLLMQYDPFDNDMGFLDSLDGFVYFFFGEGERPLDAVTLWQEYS